MILLNIKAILYRFFRRFAAQIWYVPSLLENMVVPQK
jgi:hypothetical protein